VGVLVVVVAGVVVAVVVVVVVLVVVVSRGAVYRVRRNTCNDNVLLV